MNSIRIANSQHIYPKSLIENFLDENRRVNFCSNDGLRRSDGVKTSQLSVSCLWDEASEKVWMKEIEDSFSTLSRKIKSGNHSINQSDHQLATEFYLLWYLRSYAELNSKGKVRIISKEFIDEFRHGDLNTGLILAAFQSSLDVIPLSTVPNNFHIENGHTCSIKTDSRNKLDGNQHIHSSRVLTTPPLNRSHEHHLTSTVPWSESLPNRSTLENINERESVHFFDKQGYLSSQIANGLWIELSHNQWKRRLHRLEWGVLKAVCGEFVVPRGRNDAWLIPISPTLALLANYKGNHQITCGDVLNFNSCLTRNSELWMCRQPNYTMLLNQSCPQAS